MDEDYSHVFSSYYHKKGINSQDKFKKFPPYSPKLKKWPKMMKTRSPVTNYNYRDLTVRPEGIEPSTYGLRVRCSAN